MRLWRAEERLTRPATVRSARGCDRLPAAGSPACIVSTVSRTPTAAVKRDTLVKIIKEDFGLKIDIEKLISVVDEDMSGEIEYEEFKTLLSRRPAAEEGAAASAAAEAAADAPAAPSPVPGSA